MNRRKLLKNKEFIHACVCLAILLVLLAIHLLRADSGPENPRALLDQLAELVDVEMFVSVVAAFVLHSVASFIAQRFTDHFEDDTKLTHDYDGLVKKYEANTRMIEYRNDPRADYELGRKRTGCKRTNRDGEDCADHYRFPVGDVTQLYGKEFIIHDDPQKQFVPPEFSRAHYTTLINAHNASNTYNQTTLRVDGIVPEKGAVHGYFSRTKYFDSLVTNRAIDYKIDGVSVRDMYACGPFLDSLDKSRLSNHMGFNGMVETSDSKFIFIKRHKHVSIGKNTMQCSIAASLKAKRALDGQGVLTKEKIAGAIIEEMVDELNLKKLDRFQERKAEIFAGFSFEKNVLYFYRDLVEGGKPQLMFYAKLNLTSEELKQAYTKGTRASRAGKKDEKLYCNTDGYKILFVDRQALRKIYVTPDEMIIRNTHHPAVPSAAATLVMLFQAMDQGIA